MKYIHDSTEISRDKECVVVLGNFDGIHVGHQKLLQEARNIARNSNIEVVAFSFYPPTTWVVSSNKKKLIVSREEKVKLMKFYGVDTFIEYPFDLTFSKITAEEFFQKILMKRLKAKSIVIGENYHFGAGGEGSSEYLMHLGKNNRINVNIVSTVKILDKVVSSSAIRSYITEGNIELVNKMLGRNYSVEGEVMHGKQLGRTIGFPTANLSTDENRIYPPNGVYASSIDIQDKSYLGITNIGMNPTVSGENKVIETNIFDFSGDIYNKSIKVNLYKHIRYEKKFNSLEELKCQILQDSESVKRFFCK